MPDTPVVDLATLTPDQMTFLGLRTVSGRSFWMYQISPALVIEVWIGHFNQINLRQAPAFFRVGSTAMQPSTPNRTLGSLDIPAKTARRLRLPETTADAIATTLCGCLHDALGDAAQAKLRLLAETAAWSADQAGLHERVGFQIHQQSVALLRRGQPAGPGPRLSRLNLMEWLKPVRTLEGDALEVPRDIWAGPYEGRSQHARLARTADLMAQWQEHGVDLAEFRYAYTS